MISEHLGSQLKMPLLPSGAYARLKTARYGRLAEAILEFTREQRLGLGDRIPSIRGLAKKFNVSCPTIRCALTSLEVIGHIQKVAGIGSFLVNRAASLQFAFCQESPPLLVLQACNSVEPGVVGEAALNCTADMIELIRRHFLILKLEFEKDVVEASAHSTDVRFHELLAASGGRQITIIIGELWRSFYAEANRNVIKCLSASEYRKEMLGNYEELIDAIVKQDQWLSMRAMHNHLIGLQERIRCQSAETDLETNMPESTCVVAQSSSVLRQNSNVAALLYEKREQDA
jgi:GntR family transcriptional repressor for pyruvate dehydrogenase complex